MGKGVEEEQEIKESVGIRAINEVACAGGQQVVDVRERRRGKEGSAL
jgi:hypothetical protein